jgi:hypothetical protein
MIWKDLKFSFSVKKIFFLIFDKTGPALEIQIVCEFPLKSKIWRPKPEYLVGIRRLFFLWRLREFHALYPPSAGPVIKTALFSFFFEKIKIFLFFFFENWNFPFFLFSSLEKSVNSENKFNSVLVRLQFRTLIKMSSLLHLSMQFVLLFKRLLLVTLS